MTEEEWDAVIDEMLYHLKYMDEKTVTEELEKDVPDNWFASHKTVYDILEKHKDAFFELFSSFTIFPGVMTEKVFLVILSSFKSRLNFKFPDTQNSPT
jgi:hypothetical protein